jgi:hypothetical protein
MFWLMWKRLSSDGFGERPLALSAVAALCCTGEESIYLHAPDLVEAGQRSVDARMTQPVSNRF